MTEWLDLMLEELARKKREAQEAEAENERREKDNANGPATAGDVPAQSK